MAMHKNKKSGMANATPAIPLLPPLLNVNGKIYGALAQFSYTISIDTMNERVCGALVQFSCMLSINTDISEYVKTPSILG